jgi:hypothetical protein
MFEYQILHAVSLVSQDELNKLGAQRWNLASIVKEENGYYYIFQRVVMPPGMIPNIVPRQNFNVPVVSPDKLDEVFNQGIQG